jgi:hypothetical protein
MARQTKRAIAQEKMMSKIKFITLAAAFGIALAFTFTGCSDDKDDGGGTVACKYTTNFYRPINGKNSGEICEELSEELVKANVEKHNARHDEKISISEYKKDMKKECEEEEGEDGEYGKYYDSCPSGYASKCKGEGKFYYFYENAFKDVDCDEFFDNR